MWISAVAIAIAVVVVSNLISLFPLVFLTARTVPLPLGLLALTALSSGMLASILLRLLATGRATTKRDKRAERRAQQDNFEAEQIRGGQEAPFRSVERPVDRPLHELELEEDEDLGPPIDRRSSAQGSRTVHDANYRVIRAPQPPASPQPQVNSRLKPDEEDWGFDFDEEDK